MGYAGDCFEQQKHEALDLLIGLLQESESASGAIDVQLWNNLLS